MRCVKQTVFEVSHAGRNRALTDTRALQFQRIASTSKSAHTVNSCGHWNIDVVCSHILAPVLNPLHAWHCMARTHQAAQQP